MRSTWLTFAMVMATTFNVALAQNAPRDQIAAANSRALEGLRAQIVSESIGDHFTVADLLSKTGTGKQFNKTSAGIHADGVLKSEEIYNIFDTNKVLRRPIAVGITDKSGIAGIAFWVNQQLGLSGDKQIDKRHPGMNKILEWVDKQYAAKRTTSISDDEMLEQAKLHMPDYFGDGKRVSVKAKVTA